MQATLRPLPRKESLLAVSATTVPVPFTPAVIAPRLTGTVWTVVGGTAVSRT